MSDIPADIRGLARKIAKDAIYHGGVDWASDDIARAIMAERERCAKIVEDELVEIYEDSPDIDIECNNLCRRAVAAIRNGREA